MNVPVAESAAYDNYLDASKKTEDVYNTSLDRFLEEEIAMPFLKKVEPNNKDYVQMIKVHFADLQANLSFCKKVGQIIPYEQKIIYYPLESSNGFFKEEIPPITDIDINLILPKLKIKHKNNYVLEKEWKAHWHGMPEYVEEANKPYNNVYVRIRTEADIESFGKIIGYNITPKTKFVHYPNNGKSNNMVKRWIGNDYALPRYPMYIVSKGRHESMLTSRIFAEMKLPHYIVIEPQDYDNYVEALEKFNINPYATLLVAPFSNHGDGPGRARNYAWDHSIHIGAERHWVFDDNIKDFYRMNHGNRYRAMAGSIFNAMEDFVDRYQNVMIAGPNYYFFCATTQTYPAYVPNTRIYSALLIKNDCKHRWRGRYNEDTDLSLRVLKDGDVTVQFNAFLQGKMGTQLVKGGNTAEFYHKEGVQDKEEWRGGNMNATGTINKSKMLYDMHPDVTTLVWKYGRAHHFVDYRPFAKNKLILKPGVEIPEGTMNEYGMSFTETYGVEDND